MTRIFLNKMTKAGFFFSFCLIVIISISVGCKQDNKSAAQPAAVAPTPTAVREAAAAPKEDYSAVIMEVATKQYEPLGRRILANKELLRTTKAAKESSSEIRNEKEIKDQESRQAQTEAGFVENMKMLDYLTEKENSKEMSKAQVANEKKTIQKKIQEVEAETTDLEKSLKGEKVNR